MEEQTLATLQLLIELAHCLLTTLVRFTLKWCTGEVSLSSTELAGLAREWHSSFNGLRTPQVCLDCNIEKFQERKLMVNGQLSMLVEVILVILYLANAWSQFNI